MKASIATLFILVAASFIFLSGCRRQNSAIDKSKMPTAESPYEKVYVTKAGQIMLDGKTVTLAELDGSLAALAQKHGVVLYSREAPQEEPHPIFKQALDIVIKNKLPVRLCVNSDCSDALTSDGKLRVDN